MSIAQQLKQAAIEAANQIQAHASEAKKELGEIKLRALALEAQLNQSDLALKRLADFPVKSGNDYLCPHCWIEASKSSLLRPIPSDTDDDLFRCGVCHRDILITN
jgi:hypothetical protein